jgi:hypothetical protein
VVIVFAEIQSLWLGRNPLAGIIFELAALLCFHHDTALDTEKLILVHSGGVGAIGARVRNFLSEQHICCPSVD